MVLQRFKIVKVTHSLTQGHWQSCHSIGHTWFPKSLVTMSPSCTISEILPIICQNLNRSCDRDYTHLSDCLSIWKLTLHVVNQCTKFEISSLSHSRDISGDYTYKIDILQCFDAVRWAAGRTRHPAYKNWVVRYWRGYLSGARCKWFAYGPADATATPSSLASLKPRMVYFFGAGLPGLFWKKAVEWI